MSMTHLDLFTGLAAWTIAAHALGIRTVAMCEKDLRCIDFLTKTWPGIPIYDDINTFPADEFVGRIDILSAGVPCQDASRAGKQRGAAGDRWFWPKTLEIAERVKPWCCVFENPPGIEDVGLDGILAQVEALGYEIGPVFDIPACAVDSPQLRQRYYIVGFLADSVGQGCERPESAPRTHGLCSEHPEGNHLANPNQPHGCGTEQPLPATGQRSGKEGRETVAGGTENSLANPVSEQRQGGVQQPQCGSQGRDANRGLGEGNMGDTASIGSRTGLCDFQPGGLRRDQLADATGDVADTGQISGHARWGAESQGRQGAESFNSDGGLCLNQWDDFVWLPCADGKVRRAPDDSICMAHGLPMELFEELDQEYTETQVKALTPHRSILGALGNSQVPQISYQILSAIKQVYEYSK